MRNYTLIMHEGGFGAGYVEHWIEEAENKMREISLSPDDPPRVWKFRMDGNWIQWMRTFAGLNESQLVRIEPANLLFPLTSGGSFFFSGNISIVSRAVAKSCSDESGRNFAELVRSETVSLVAARKKGLVGRIKISLGRRAFYCAIKRRMFFEESKQNVSFVPAVARVEAAKGWV